MRGTLTAHASVPPVISRTAPAPAATNLTRRHIMRPALFSLHRATWRKGFAMTDFDQLLIGGQWVAPSGDQRIEVRSPATLDVVGTVPEALEADVDAAVAAARTAFDHGP